MEDREIVCAIDIETHDPHLKIWGPGSIRRDGFILGVGAYCPELGVDTYYDPNDPALRKLLAYNVTKVFHNGVYDLDWLINGEYHFEIGGRIEDTMTREALLDAYDFSYSLDHCCDKHNVVGKNKEDTIDAWWAAQGNRTKAVEHLKDIPRYITAKYCKQDCKATYDLYHAQTPLLAAEELLYANDIECRLYPWLMHTRSNGMIIDWDARRKLSDNLNDELEQAQNSFNKKYGELNINSGADLARLWERLGIPIEYTEKGKPSFSADVLEASDAPVAAEILHIRSIEKLLNTFIDGQFVDLSYDGRLWPTLYPAKRDSGGTVTGRFSSQNPNGQNIPARGEKHGKEIRSMFIPEEDCLLGAFDYKQIEYRIFTHFAVGPGADAARQRYAEDPSTDYHRMGQDMMGWSFPDDPDKDKSYRHLMKNLGFGSIYGLGWRSFAERFHSALVNTHPDVPAEEIPMLAKHLQDMYYSKIPFIKTTCRKIQDVATSRGYVKTISGRRQRVPKDGKLYKIVNYLIQGSAGDLFKKAMVDAWESGVFNTLKCHIMVHDECVFSIPRNKEGKEAAEQLASCMCNAYKLKVPIGVDTEIGPDWGHCNEDNWKQFTQGFISKEE
jgi:DNA polymerase I-like protein with 3'-5' exonuclease and polymerase domains